MVIDKRIPVEAKNKLLLYGEVVEFATSNITDEAISGHPDIFFCQTSRNLIAAPNLPVLMKDKLVKRGVHLKMGDHSVGEKYPDNSHYNVASTNKFLVHNIRFTDPAVLSLYQHLEIIQVAQGYTRCNLIALDEFHFITSDRGIEKSLNNKYI